VAATTRLSSKGQVVIPADVRRRLNLTAGDELRIEVASEADRTIVIRAQPTSEELQRLLERWHRWFAERGVDPVEELHESRRKARIQEAQRERRWQRRRR
jgi:AbrB family looped-hinge helix DNA binding protein